MCTTIKPTFSEIYPGYTQVEMTFSLYPANHPAHKEMNTGAIVHNVLNVADWIPLLGVISGIFRLTIAILIYALGQKEEAPASMLTWAFYEGVRGTISTLGLGLLFIVPDILFTIHRALLEHAKEGSVYTCRLMKSLE